MGVGKGWRDKGGGEELRNGACGFPLWEGTIPTKPRSRSVPDVAVLNSRFRFLRNCSLSTNVFQGASFGIVPSQS